MTMDAYGITRGPETGNKLIALPLLAAGKRAVRSSLVGSLYWRVGSTQNADFEEVFWAMRLIA